MLEFEYELITDEKKEKRIFHPAIAKRLDNLVLVEGPNSSGKSTLLNILAIAFYGENDSKIHPSLRRKMEDLLHSSYQSLTFDVTLVAGKEELKIISRKEKGNSPEISVIETEGGRQNRLSLESFRRKYELIYDIPDDPTNRIIQLTDDLKYKQIEIGNRLTGLSGFIRQVISDIKDTRDPKKIEEYHNTINTLKEDLRLDEEKEKAFRDELLRLEKYTYCRFYNENMGKIAKTESQIRSLSLKKTSERKAEYKLKIEEIYLKAKTRDTVNRISRHIQDLKAVLEPILSDKIEHVFSVWENGQIDITDILCNPEENDLLIQGIARCRKVLSDYIQNNKVLEQKAVEGGLIEKLIELLKSYYDCQMVIPGVGKKIPEFVVLLEEQFSLYKNEKITKDNVDSAVRSLSEIERERREFIQENTPKIKKLIESAKGKGFTGYEVLEDSESQIEQLRIELENYRSKFKKYEYECKRINLNLEESEEIYSNILKEGKIPYVNHTEEQLNSAISDMSGKIAELYRNSSSKKHRIALYEQEKMRMEKKEPHKHQDSLVFINNLFDKTQKLSRLVLNDFNECLSNVRDLQSNPEARGRLSSEKKRYYDKIAQFLGAKIHEIRHVDKEYVIDKIDWLDKTIHTTTGHVIHLDSLGTGQGQSAYLKGLLNSIHGKKVIALIDEVAMMDSTSIKPIYDKLRELYYNNKLLLGVVVQRADNLKVTSLM